MELADRLKRFHLAIKQFRKLGNSWVNCKLDDSLLVDLDSFFEMFLYDNPELVYEPERKTERVIHFALTESQVNDLCYSNRISLMKPVLDAIKREYGIQLRKEHAIND